MSKEEAKKNKNRKRKKLFTEKNKLILLFLSPAILLYIAIYAYPLISIVATSFTKWNYENFLKPEFLGFKNIFDNYIKLFTLDQNFQVGLINTVKWVLLVLLIQVPLSTITAFILSRKPFGWKLTRNAFIIPNITSSAAIGLIFLNIYNPKIGIVTQIGNILVPGSDLNILSDGNLAFIGITLSFILYGGTNSVMLLTQIFSIDESIYEAARIDGASEWEIIKKITLPLIKPMIGTVSLLAANYALLLYNEIALITGGGPDNSTYSLSYYIYRTSLGSTQLNFARANTAGVIQIILGLLLAISLNMGFNQNRKLRRGGRKI